MDDTSKQRLIFIHGLLSSGQSYKANLLRGYFPDILTPDFEGSLEERMAQLESILSDQWADKNGDGCPSGGPTISPLPNLTCA